VPGAVDRATEAIDRDGRATTYQYDGIGRETGENWYDASSNLTESISNAYNSAGELQSATDENSTTSTDSYSYDAAGEVTSETQTIPGLAPTVTLSDQYTAGNRSQLAAMIGSEGSANYDFVDNYQYGGLFGQMSQVTQQSFAGAPPPGDTADAVAEKSVTFAYDNLGEFSTVTRYADLAQTEAVATAAYGYDAEGNLTSLTYSQSNSTLPSYTWTYDPLGNVATATNNTDGTVTYASDSTGQLTGATGGPSTETYSYDSNGNRTNAGYVTGWNNELLSDGVYNYEYDAEGNRIARWVQNSSNSGQTAPAAGDTDITLYTWDNRDRLTSVKMYSTYAELSAGTADQTVAYTYDAFNRWIGETINAGTASETKTLFVYDGNQIVMQFDKAFDGTGGDQSAAASDLSHRYLWGPAVDQLLADEQVGSGLTQSGNVVWTLADSQNTVRDLATYDAQTNTTTVVNHRVFSAYGQLLSQSDPQAADCLFAYTGRPLDQATGLQNNLNRWYEAITGRWLSQDPSGLGPDANPYRYCGNGPTNGADPSGLGQTGDQGQEAPKFLPGRLPNPAFWDLPGSAPRAPTLGYSDGYTPLPKFLPGRNMPNPAFWDPPGSARRAPTPGYSGGYTPLPLRIFPPGKSLSPPRIYVLPPTQMRVPRPPDMDGIPPLPDLPPEPRYQYPNPLFPAPRPLPCSDPPDSPPMSPGGRSKGMV